MFVLKFINGLQQVLKNNHGQHIPPTEIIEHVSGDSRIIY